MGARVIEKFIEEYGDRGYQFALHLCGNAEEAKELVQEAFFRLIRRAEVYDDSQPFENWFIRVLRNIYFDGLKRCDRRLAVSLDMPIDAEGLSLADALADGSLPMLEQLERDKYGREVNEAFDAVPPEQRAVLALSDVQGLNYEQISEALDCPLGTVKSRLYRGRAAFRKAYCDSRKEVSER